MQLSVAWWKETLCQTCSLLSSECLHISSEPVSYLLLCIDPILQVFTVLYINCEPNIVFQVFSWVLP